MPVRLYSIAAVPVVIIYNKRFSNLLCPSTLTTEEWQEKGEGLVVTPGGGA
jgi:hypothetical protein